MNDAFYTALSQCKHATQAVLNVDVRRTGWKIKVVGLPSEAYSDTALEAVVLAQTVPESGIMSTPLKHKDIGDRDGASASLPVLKTELLALMQHGGETPVVPDAPAKDVPDVVKTPRKPRKVKDVPDSEEVVIDRGTHVDSLNGNTTH